MAGTFAEGPVFGSLEDTFEALRAHEIATTTRYVSVASTKSFGLTEIDPTKAKKVSWSGAEPCVFLGKKVLHCHHGKDKHVKQKDKYRKEKNRKAASGDHNGYVRQGRFWAQRTKKLGCPARITIKEVLVFPDVKGGASKKSRASASSAIRSSLVNGKRMFIMTGTGEHSNHPVGELAGLSQRVDSSLIGEIHKLVDDGVSRPGEIQRHLRTHVKSDAHDVQKTNRRFYPTTRTIRSHMDTHEKKTAKSTDDQQNVKNLKFLLVYQSTWMKKLLGRYGNQMTMLDATYRTSRYALPLFFLAVRTNVDHQIVGVFIVEDETTSCIKEALGMIVQQNPQWKPEFYMTDFDEREISAMDHFFPEAKGILCDFHVVQAWKRWLIKKKNGVQEEAGTLAALQKLRMAATIPEFDTSLKELKASSLWCPISSYLEKVWLPQKKKWAHCCRSGELPVGIHTNNGIEGLNSSLKKNYLDGKTVMTITKMVGTVIKTFLPDKHKCYIDENLKMTGTLKRYDETVPEFLEQRPPTFIQHCMKRIELSRDCKEAIRIDEGNFCINTYQICTGDSETYPICSCPDFRHYILPCKHLFRAITEANVVHWDRLSSKYRASPYINVDDEVLGTEETGRPAADNTSVEEDDLTQFYDVHLDLNKQGADSVNAVQSTSKTVDGNEAPSGKDDRVKIPYLQKELREVLDELKTQSYLIEDETTLTTIIQKIKQVKVDNIPKSETLRRLPERLKLRKRKKVVKDRFANDRVWHSKENSTVSDGIVGEEIYIEYQGDLCGEKNEVVSQAAADESEAFKLVTKLWQLPKDYHIPVAKVMGTTVTDADIRSAKGSGWLTDTILDCYLEMLAQWECDKGKKVLHLANTEIDNIVDGTYTTQTPKFKLSDYEVVIGVHCRALHWTLIVADIASRTLFFYNPVEEQQDEMKRILDGWSQFIEFYSNQSGDSIGKNWTITTQPHVRQVDGHSCGVLCMIFAEKHLSGASLTDPVSLEDMRKKVATKMMLFEEYLTGCCPKCGCLVKDEEMMQCCSCLRSYHFKPYCIEDDIHEMNDADQFQCKLCRINFWPVERCSKLGDIQGIDVPWTEKDKVLTKLRQTADTADVKFTGEETVTVKKYPERTRKRKRQRSSFIYPPLKKPTKLYCLCKQPNDGKLYWQCGDCKEWFHPACVGDITNNEPDIFICPVCLKKPSSVITEGNSEEKSCEFPIPSLLKDADDEDEGDAESSYFITAETACKHMKAAIQRVQSVVEFKDCNSIQPWMRNHYSFRSGGRAATHGYGYAVFSLQAIECAKFYIRQQFFKYEYRRAYSKRGQIVGLKDTVLETSFVQDIHLAATYVRDVLLREGLAAIFESVTGSSYDGANKELRIVLNKSTFKATCDGIKLSDTKKVELSKLYAT